MSKHHHQSKAEQIDNKAHDAGTFHRESVSKYASKSAKSQDIPANAAAADDNAIQLRAYQIYQEKGGSDLDNWLEAERTLKNTDQAVSRLINEGNPNTQTVLKKGT